MQKLIADPREKIENFDWFEPWLGRGGQPDEDGYRSLDHAGIRYVVNLRERDEAADVERWTRHGIPVHIPVPNDHAPTDEQALRWLVLCAQRGDAKLFVHCHAGHGRTSTFCVLVRLAAGADLEQTVAEERRYGFDPDHKHRLQYEFLKSFNDRLRSGQNHAFTGRPHRRVVQSRALTRCPQRVHSSPLECDKTVIMSHSSCA